ncbi:CD48 antigen [Labeo rohita]|uniref:CD48 antigen n=1 Tax=Labeo rohita TaxID=84645 RepID=A0ABQ8LK54_LABRO|nr:CD48 antigen [Labeo rohita]
MRQFNSAENNTIAQQDAEADWSTSRILKSSILGKYFSFIKPTSSDTKGSIYDKLCSSGVFGDEVKSVSVRKGESVTLNTDLTELMDDDLIQWKFLNENALIAEINVTADSMTVYDDVFDGRFRDRLKLDNQTGSLTITNIRNEHNGGYKLEINHMSKDFFLAVDDEISVKKGDSVTLNSGLTEIMDGYLILWTYMNENALIPVANKLANMTLYNDEDLKIAEINKQTDSITVYDDHVYGRFRDRLKLDNQTGSLTITNIRNRDSGVYTLKISFLETVFILCVFGALIAEINKRANRFSVYDYVFDGRFRDRLKLDNQTGSLTITNTTTEHAGDYKLQINAFIRPSLRLKVCDWLSSSSSSPSSSSSSSGSYPNSIRNHTQHLNITQFCQTCSDSVHCCGSTEAVIRLVLSALVGVATVILLVYDIRSRRAEQDQAHIHTSET